MSVTSEKVRYDAQLELPQCLAYLESIVRGLRDGQLLMSKGEDTIALSPGSAIRVQFKAKSKPNKHSLDIHLSWADAIANDNPLTVVPGELPSTLSRDLPSNQSARRRELLPTLPAQVEDNASAEPVTAALVEYVAAEVMDEDDQSEAANMIAAASRAEPLRHASSAAAARSSEEATEDATDVLDEANDERAASAEESMAAQGGDQAQHEASELESLAAEQDELRAQLMQLSKTDLYEKAQRLSLDGRSQMTKADMVAALMQRYGAADLFTRAELYERAKDADVSGRSGMDKEALLAALTTSHDG